MDTVDISYREFLETLKKVGDKKSLVLIGTRTGLYALGLCIINAPMFRYENERLRYQFNASERDQEQGAIAKYDRAMNLCCCAVPVGGRGHGNFYFLPIAKTTATVEDWINYLSKLPGNILDQKMLYYSRSGSYFRSRFMAGPVSTNKFAIAYRPSDLTIRIGRGSGPEGDLEAVTDFCKSSYGEYLPYGWGKAVIISTQSDAYQNRLEPIV